LIYGSSSYFTRGARGFTQLAAELIAISEVEEGDVFYGAVTIGDVWRFGRL
jgi:hypothetical protein